MTADNSDVRLGVLSRKGAVVSVAAAYTLARVWMFAGATTLVTPDSRDYLNPHHPLFSLAFFSGHKPWFVPFFWLLAAGNLTIGTSVQLVSSIAAWLFLASELRSSIGHARTRTIAFSAVLLLSLSPIIAQWDAAILSESLSLTLGATVVGLLLRSIRQPSANLTLLLIGAAACWAGTRDTNAYVVLALLPATALLLHTRGQSRLAATLALAAVAICTLSIWGSSSPRRWELLSVDLIDERVLASPTALSYFTERGMPNPPDLRLHLFADRTPFSRFQGDPYLKPFRRWLLAHSRATYLGYLIDNPSASLLTPLQKIDQLNAADAISHYRPAGFRSVIPKPLEELAYPPSGSSSLIWSTIACAIAALLALRRSIRSDWLIGGLLVLSTIPHTIVVWDAEPREVGRHALLVGVFDRLGMIILLGFVVEALLLMRQTRLAASTQKQLDLKVEQPNSASNPRVANPAQTAR